MHCIIIDIISGPSVTVIEVQEVTIRNFIPHPVMVVALNLTSLRTETGKPLPQ